MSEDTAHRLFVVGLRNARALEHEALALLTRQIERADNYPDLKARLVDHLEETKGQIQRLDAIFSALDESTSTLKETAMWFMGNMAALSHVPASDEVLKNSFASNAFENLEIASYKSLITLADAAGFRAHFNPLTTTLWEEKAMAEWLDDNVQAITQRFLELESASENGKA
ncbi:ferritin-like domain-containing protein [Terrihabitans sp. B22-R8]|uniref:ferritin-like domain-containing protein n=1 Tax=Terrihabitans sp. B22-R8 TaxID=3425128 RepID=UPI00403CB73A